MFISQEEGNRDTGKFFRLWHLAAFGAVGNPKFALFSCEPYILVPVGLVTVPAIKTEFFCLCFCFAGLTVSVPGMEKALHQYTLEPSDKPFDMKTVPLATAPVFEQKAGNTWASFK